MPTFGHGLHKIPLFCDLVRKGNLVSMLKTLPENQHSLSLPLAVGYMHPARLTADLNYLLITVITAASSLLTLVSDLTSNPFCTFKLLIDMYVVV